MRRLSGLVGKSTCFETDWWTYSLFFHIGYSKEPNSSVRETAHYLKLCIFTAVTFKSMCMNENINYYTLVTK